MDYGRNVGKMFIWNHVYKDFKIKVYHAISG